MAFKEIIILLILSPAFVFSYPNVCLDSGCIQGTYMNDTKGQQFDAFFGIPFAQPPVGDLRFRNPVPVKRWNGLLEASQPKLDCIQMNTLASGAPIYGSEDCLYLNVYRPMTSNEASVVPFPVMIYIFGGGFFSGSTNPSIVGPEFFMENGKVILVTVSYRLGPFGFLSTGDKNMPGNFGLKDQRLAIEFVKSNIQKFGGDPNLITVFGQSAGGVSTHLQMLASPISEKKLFQRAIVMSGVATVPFGILETDPLDQVRRQASFVGVKDYETLSTQELAKALRLVDAYTLLKSGMSFKFFDVDPLTVFKPVVEAPSSGAFLTEHPRIIIKKGKYHNIPLMVGMVPNEGAVRSLSISENDNLRAKFNENFDKFLFSILEFKDISNKVLNSWRIKHVIDHYFDGKHELNNENAQGFVDLLTDLGFYRPLYKLKEVYQNNSNSGPLYFYNFDYRGTLSYSFLYAKNTNNYGTVHCDDLIYLFNSPLLFPNNFAENSPDKIVSQELVNRFVHFAIKGNPSNEAQACTKNACPYEFIRKSRYSDKLKIKPIDCFDKDPVEFWDKLSY